MRCAIDRPHCGCGRWYQASLAAGPNLLMPLHHVAASTASQALRPPPAQLAAKLVTFLTALNTPDLERARSSRLNAGVKKVSPPFTQPELHLYLARQPRLVQLLAVKVVNFLTAINSV